MTRSTLPGWNSDPHVLVLVESEAEALAVLSDLTLEAVREGTRVVPVIGSSYESHGGALSLGTDDDLGRAVSQGHVAPIWMHRVLPVPNKPKQESALEVLSEHIDRHGREHPAGTTVVGDMTWTIDLEFSARFLGDFEQGVRSIFPASAGALYCIYDGSRLTPEQIMRAVHTHPFALLKCRLFANPLYGQLDDLASI